MKLNSTLRAWLGGLLMLIGVLIGLALSATATWGEIEAGVYTPYNADNRFGLKCPLMLAPDEMGVVQATIVNQTTDVITPQVSVEISHAPMPIRNDQTVSLKARESTTVQWTVSGEDVIYQHLILVTVLQLRYRDNPSRLGACSILLFGLFGIGGKGTLMIIMIFCLAAMLSGAWLWRSSRGLLDEFSTNLARIGITLMAITVLSFISMLLRWWGLTLFFDALILLVIGVILTDFGIFRG